MRLLFAVFFSLMVIGVNAQGDKSKELGVINRLKAENPNEGVVKINQDPRLDSLLNVHVLYNNLIGINGYRIMIYDGNGNNARKKMYDVRSEFVLKFPNLKVTEEYEEINYKLKVGDYRNINEAYVVLKQIEKHFPEAIIRPDKIDFPRLDERN